MYNDNLAYKENQGFSLSGGDSLRVADPACLINHIGTNGNFKNHERFKNDYFYQMDRKVKESFEQSYERVNGFPLDFVTSEDIRPDYTKWLRRYETYSYRKQGDVVALNVKYCSETENMTDFWQQFKQKRTYGQKREKYSKTMSKRSAWRLKQVLLQSDLSKFTNKQMLFVTLTFPNPVQNIEKIKRFEAIQSAVQEKVQRWLRLETRVSRQQCSTLPLVSSFPAGRN